MGLAQGWGRAGVGLEQDTRTLVQAEAGRGWDGAGAGCVRFCGGAEAGLLAGAEVRAEGRGGVGVRQGIRAVDVLTFTRCS